MTQPLSALDATFLELEEADRTAHMHVGGVMVFDQLPEGGAPGLEALRDQLERRLAVLPRHFERLSRSTAGGLSWPHWERDEHFAIEAHVRRAALPAPGDDAELLDWAAEFYSVRLDRTRALWEMVVVEGLAGGRWALATKTHHCMVDGISAMDVGRVLLDAAPKPAEPPPAEPPRAPAARHHRALGVAAAPLHALRTGAELALRPQLAKEAFDGARGLVELLVRDEIQAAPQTSLSVPLCEHRRLATQTVRLGDLRRIKAALGGTVNDVVLALVTGGLRRLLLARDEALPAAGLRAMVPVDIRSAGQHLALGNQVSSLFVWLPVGRADPLKRYEDVRDEARMRKAGHQAAGGRALVELGGLAPPLVHAVAARTVFATRLFNVTVTNVPGPQMPLYAMGARLRRIIPIVPLAAEHALAVAALSYDGDVCLCVNADRDAVPDVDELIGGMADELDALLACAEARQAEQARA